VATKQQKSVGEVSNKLINMENRGRSIALISILSDPQSYPKNN
jgi:hypothetical protein